MDEGKISIAHGQVEGKCGVVFEPRGVHLVLAHAQIDGGYTTSLCSIPEHSLEEFEAALETSD